jgi:carbon storage regulator
MSSENTILIDIGTRIDFKEEKMLVLSRYRDESIYIGDDVVVTIVDIRGDRVRIGIQAPPDIAVHRQEIYDVIAREKHGVHNLEQTPIPTPELPKTQKFTAPLEKKLEARKNKGLPVDIDSSTVSFGSGIADIISQ